jgi:hypothetical protein
LVVEGLGREGEVEPGPEDLDRFGGDDRFSGMVLAQFLPDGTDVRFRDHLRPDTAGRERKT